jgi:hypothetical protein
MHSRKGFSFLAQVYLSEATIIILDIDVIPFFPISLSSNAPSLHSTEVEADQNQPTTQIFDVLSISILLVSFFQKEELFTKAYNK